MPEETSLKVAVGFRSKHCIQKRCDRTQRQEWLNLTEMCAFVSYLSVRERDSDGENPKAASGVQPGEEY